MFVSSGDGFLVLDTCFDASTAAALSGIFETMDLAFVHDGGWRKPWKLSDGNCLKGREVFSCQIQSAALTQCYPTGLVIDALIEFLNEQTSCLSRVVGAKGQSWDMFSVRP